VVSIFFLFFLAQSQRSEIGYLPYFHTWCGLNANLECMSEMCCKRLAGNTARKNRHFGTIWQLCRAVSSQLKHVSTIGKKRNLLNTDTSSTCPHNMVNLWSPYAIGQTISFLPYGFYLLLFFLAYSQRSEIGCLPYYHTRCGLSANLECMSEVCCMRLAENTGRKNRHFGTIGQLCRDVSSQLRHVSTIGKKTR